MDQIEDLLTRGVDKIYPSPKALKDRLTNKDKLKAYHGVDPTGNRLHIGHSIGLTKLQQFADAGHEAILLFGTGTVLVGDPSLRAKARATISREEIESNIKTWKDQVSSIIDFEKVQVRQNADWLLPLTLSDIISIASHISAVQLFKRDNFQTRIDRGDTVWMHETLYPLLQGYDSVAMDVDLEIGGTDQTFNMLVGRELVSKMKHKEKYVLTVPMIAGTDGLPMSKSSGNCIWLTDTPVDMFGKVMSIPDDSMDSYEAALVGSDEYPSSSLSPIDRKKQLAHTLVTKFHNRDKADAAKANFEKTVQDREVPDVLPEYSVGTNQNIIDILVESKLTETRSEAKRLIQQGGVEIDGAKVTDQGFSIPKKDSTILKAGKRKFIKLIHTHS